MKKDLRLTTLLQIGGTICGAYAVYKLIPTTANLSKTQALIEEVWEKNKELLCKDLGLQQEPVLKFVDDMDIPMFTISNTEYANTIVSSIVLSTKSTYVIHVNAKIMHRMIKSYKISFLSNRAVEPLITIMLAHECRHIWQAQEGFLVGKETPNFNINLMTQGYGEAEEEVDANTYAHGFVTRFKKPLYAAIALQFKNSQELYGKNFIRYTESINALRLLSEAFIACHFPFYKPSTNK